MQVSDPPSDVGTLIREIWRSSYVHFDATGRPGLSVSEFVREADLHHNADSIESLEYWIMLFDEFAAWYMSFAAAVVLDEARNPKRSLVWRVYCPLLSYISSQHLAIRRLVLSGFDVAAKQLVRSLVEYLDLATLLALSPDLMEPFSQTDTPEASNHFWHTHIARGKARRTIRRHVSIPDEYLELWRNEEDSILSMTTHPSILASQMSLLSPGASEDDFWLGFFGARSESSNRTLQYTMFASLYFLTIGYNQLINTSESNAYLRRLSNDNTLHNHVKYGRVVLLGILSFVAHSDWNGLEGTRSCDHWFDGASGSE